jgi:hypothetical protein
MIKDCEMRVDARLVEKRTAKTSYESIQTTSNINHGNVIGRYNII